jgi:3-deoxy-D-manno-octulosonate 8-phosphate phosphatase (KDO 8-P phosphatase)
MEYWKTFAKTIKIVLMDCDGVLTDTGMYYSAEGDMLKRFCTHDGMGIKLLQEAGIKSGIITGEKTQSIVQRANKLGMEYTILGSSHKLKAAQDICKAEGISLEEAAFIGDDINDVELLRAVSLAACPSNARPQVKQIPNILHLSARGGDGAVREFCDFILESRGFQIADMPVPNSQ